MDSETARSILAAATINSFGWSKSPEGSNYWMEVHRALRDNISGNIPQPLYREFTHPVDEFFSGGSAFVVRDGVYSGYQIPPVHTFEWAGVTFLGLVTITPYAEIQDMNVRLAVKKLISYLNAAAYLTNDTSGVHRSRALNSLMQVAQWSPYEDAVKAPSLRKITYLKRGV